MKYHLTLHSYADTFDSKFTWFIVIYPQWKSEQIFRKFIIPP